MGWILVCPDDFLFRVAGGTLTDDVRCLVASRRAAARIRAAGGKACVGDFEDASTYRRLPGEKDDPLLVAVPAARQARTLAVRRRARPAAPVVLLSDDRVRRESRPGIATLSADVFATRVLEPAISRAINRARVDRLRAHFAKADRMLILIQ